MPENDHLYHKPDAEAVAKMTQLRAACIEFEQLLDDCCPSTRELAIAKTKLEEVRMWANKAIAITCPAVPLGQ